MRLFCSEFLVVALFCVCSTEAALDLQIKVLAYKRPHSLLRLLSSLNTLETNGSAIDVDIIIDHPVNSAERTHESNQLVYKISTDWAWTHGKKNVVRKVGWVGLQKQWFECHIPHHRDDWALILEDDVEISPYAYQWLVRAIITYGNRSDVAGISLAPPLDISMVPGMLTPTIENSDTPFLLQHMGMWGFVPKPDVWEGFLEWVSQMKNYSPAAYYNGTRVELRATKWFRTLESRQRGHSMWTAHFVQFCNENNLSILFPPSVLSLAVNWLEAGEHFDKVDHQNFAKTAPTVMTSTNPRTLKALSKFPRNILMLDWAGNPRGHTHAKEHGGPLVAAVRQQTEQVNTDTTAAARRRLGIFAAAAYGGFDGNSESGAIDADDMLESTASDGNEAVNVSCTSNTSNVLEKTTHPLLLPRFRSYKISWGQYVVACFAVLVVALLLRALWEPEHSKRQIWTLDFLVVVSELLFWVSVSTLSEVFLPSTALPALSSAGGGGGGSSGPEENLDGFWGSMVLLIGYSLTRVRKLGPREQQMPLNRAQTNEWKGWMQVAFVLYHYFRATSLFASVRVLVSAYVWMTGFGNGVYFWSKLDFSLARFLQMYWRMNFLVVPLAMATNTDWILYYVVALHTTHFTLIYISLYAASKVCSRQQGQCAGTSEKLISLATFAALTALIWEIPGVYESTLGAALKEVFGSFFNEYFWYRTRMDCWYVVPLILH